MKSLILSLIFSASVTVMAQSKAENLIIITLDGMRWQEVFAGMDSVIANNHGFNQDDSELIYKNFWNSDPELRRKKLFPFLWTTVAAKGQLWGNRNYGNYVNNANPYWFSFPGYSELLTGFVDTSLNSNEHPGNPNESVLEFLNRKSAFKGKVAAFGAWIAFDRIINEKRAGLPVYSAFDTIGGKNPNVHEMLINAMKRDAFRPFNDQECLDVFTQYSAMEYLKSKWPKVLYIAYGETDEWAHAGHYRSYLNAAKQTDAFINAIWTWLQVQSQYRNKTTLFITTDHGRGDIVKSDWANHNNKVPGADQIWFAVMGPGIKPGGEIKTSAQLYQKQFAQTLARILGYTFSARHPVANSINEIFK
jgi:hypothetical protein